MNYNGPLHLMRETAEYAKRLFETDGCQFKRSKVPRLSERRKIVGLGWSNDRLVRIGSVTAETNGIHPTERPNPSETETHLLFI
jgi:hypothetical protein